MNKESRSNNQPFSSKRSFARQTNTRRNVAQSRRHTRAEGSDSSGPTLLNTWSPMREAVSSAPCSPGIFKIGLAHGNWIEVVYIGCSGSNRTLREVITSIMYGFEGGERLAMMVVNPLNRKKLVLQWISSVFPEELIEDELEEFIATNHKIPEYNIPIDPTKGLYVVVDYHVTRDQSESKDNHRKFYASTQPLLPGSQTSSTNDDTSSTVTCCHCSKHNLAQKVIRFSLCNVKVY